MNSRCTARPPPLACGTCVSPEQIQSLLEKSLRRPGSRQDRWWEHRARTNQTRNVYEREAGGRESGPCSEANLLTACLTNVSIRTSPDGEFWAHADADEREE